MDLAEIKRIIKLMDEHDLSHFHLEQDGVKIKLTKGMNADEIAEMLSKMKGELSAHAAPPPQPLPAPAPQAPASLPEAEDDLSDITSPMVGTYYKAASPESAAFVKIGDRVTEDTVICIIEAMKVMNEIKAECSGTIADVLVKDGTAVQFGEVLFKVKPD